MENIQTIVDFKSALKDFKFEYKSESMRPSVVVDWVVKEKIKFRKPRKDSSSSRFSRRKPHRRVSKGTKSSYRRKYGSSLTSKNKISPRKGYGASQSKDIASSKTPKSKTSKSSIRRLRPRRVKRKTRESPNLRTSDSKLKRGNNIDTAQEDHLIRKVSGFSNTKDQIDMKSDSISVEKQMTPLARESNKKEFIKPLELLQQNSLFRNEEIKNNTVIHRTQIRNPENNSDSNGGNNFPYKEGESNSDGDPQENSEDDFSRAERLQEGNNLSPSSELERISDHLEEEQTLDYSEGGESELDWEIRHGRIKEMVTELISESEKAVRSFLDSKVTREINKQRNVYDPMFDDLSVRINSLSEEMKVFCSGSIDEMATTIEKKLEKNMEDQYQKQQSILDYINQQKIKRKRDKSDIFEEMNKVRIGNRDNYANIKRQTTEIHNLAQIMRALIEAEKINQSLQIQDEQDRHSIALWGLSQTQKHKKSKATKLEEDDSPNDINFSTLTNNPPIVDAKNDFKSSLVRKNPNMTFLNSDLKLSPRDNSFRKTPDCKYKKVANKSQIENSPFDTSPSIQTPSYQIPGRARSSLQTKITRKSQSVHRRSVNPYHYKRSLPKILQTKGSNNADGILKIDQRCYSCCNQNAVVLNAFKVACLGYFPTNVQYGPEVYSRYTLLIHRSNIVNSQWKIVKDLLPFGKEQKCGEKYIPDSRIKVENLYDPLEERNDIMPSSFDIQPLNSTFHEQVSKKNDFMASLNNDAATFPSDFKTESISKNWTQERPLDHLATKSISIKGLAQKTVSIPETTPSVKDFQSKRDFINSIFDSKKSLTHTGRSSINAKKDPSTKK